MENYEKSSNFGKEGLESETGSLLNAEAKGRMFRAGSIPGAIQSRFTLIFVALFVVSLLLGIFVGFQLVAVTYPSTDAYRLQTLDQESSSAKTLQTSNQSEDATSLVLKLEHAIVEYQEIIKARELIVNGPCKFSPRLCKSPHYFRMTQFAPVYPCPFEVHMGPWGEGGKWLCDNPRAIPVKSGIVYSIGSNGDPSFEATMYQKFQLVSHTFDPTLHPKKLKAVSGLPYLQFHNIGLTGEADPEEAKAKFKNMSVGNPLAAGAEFMHIDKIMQMLGHTYVDVFKIDCEGCETSFFEYLKGVAVREKPLFGQIQVEIHTMDENVIMGMVSAIEGLGYRLFHVEPNFFCSSCMELAYIHESLT